jgi:hypothetical protein
VQVGANKTVAVIITSQFWQLRWTESTERPQHYQLQWKCALIIMTGDALMWMGVVMLQSCTVWLEVVCCDVTELYSLIGSCVLWCYRAVQFDWKFCAVILHSCIVWLEVVCCDVTELYSLIGSCVMWCYRAVQFDWKLCDVMLQSCTLWLEVVCCDVTELYSLIRSCVVWCYRAVQFD